MNVTTAPDPVSPNRRGVFAAEVTVLAVAVVVDMVLLLRGRPTLSPTSALLGPLVPAVGPAVAVLAVLRRRFATRMDLLDFAVAGLSLLSTVGTFALRAAEGVSWVYPGVTEILALTLLTGAACRRLPVRKAVAVAIVNGIAMVSAPVARYGIGSPDALLAVPAALLLGGAVALGLVLRDADARRRAELTDVRTGERLQLARELHDFVAHHVSGIVVRAQAARAIAASPTATPQDPAQVYAEIEEAGAEALSAMRRLVSMLRTPEPIAVLPGSGFGDAVRKAVGDHGVAGATSTADITVDIADDLEELPVRPELAITAHRVVMEALTNIRRHAPAATRIGVSVGRDEGQVVVEISNDGVEARPANRSGSGFGLVGITERVTALGGGVHAGAAPGRCWHVVARLPLEPGRMLAEQLPEGIP
jgi:signal transduction histidine kinase